MSRMNELGLEATANVLPDSLLKETSSVPRNGKAVSTLPGSEPVSWFEPRSC